MTAWVRRAAVAGVAAWAVAGGVGPAGAVETKVIRDETFAQFGQGETTGTELLARGRLRVGPRVERLDKTDEAVGWRVAVDPVDGATFFSTGNSGKVFRHAGGGKPPELWAKLPEGQAISLRIDPTGGVLIGASPGGKIYRATQAGKPQLLFDTKEPYVWDMIFDREGTLYAATGPNGKVFRIRGPQNGEVYFDSEATNIMALGFDGEGRLLAATQGRGTVARIDGPGAGGGLGRAYTLYSSPDDEVRALASDQRTGVLYAAVNGARSNSAGAGTLLDGAAATALRALAGLAAGVPERNTGAGGPGGGGSGGPGGGGPGGASGGGGSASYIVQIQPSGFVSRLWDCPEGPIHTLLADPETSGGAGGLLVGAGSKGRLYRVDVTDGGHSTAADVDEPMILSAAAAGPGRTVFTTARKAGLYALEGRGREGLFLSRPLNAGGTVRWGNVALEAEIPEGASVAVETRTGNTPEPTEKSWTGFTTATLAGDRTYKTSGPVAQYLQYRLTLRTAAGANASTSAADTSGTATAVTAGSPGASPVIDNVLAHFTQRNGPPVVRDIDVSKAPGFADAAARRVQQSQAAMRAGAGAFGGGFDPGGASGNTLLGALGALGGGGSAGGRPPAPGGGNFSGRPGQPGGAGSADAGEGRPSAAATPENTQLYTVLWDALDPNGDRLRATVFLKAEDETEWRPLEKDLPGNGFPVRADTLPDGKYRVKVEVTDAADNPDDSATTAALGSRVFTVDNTPPSIARVSVKRLSAPGADGGPAGGEWEVSIEARDETSVISGAESNLDNAKEPRALAPDDAVCDSPRETFTTRAKPERAAAEHVLSFRVFDREGNARTGKVLLR